MLKLANIKFPITFQSRGVGHYTFTDKNTCHKFWSHSDKPELSTMEIEHFIDAHNSLYEKTKDYGYAMPGYTFCTTNHIKAKCYQCAQLSDQRFIRSR